jgi:hypothetical protein
MDRFELDLGLELNKWQQSRPSIVATPTNPIGQARQDRANIERRQGVAMTNPAIAASMTGSGAP